MWGVIQRLPVKIAFVKQKYVPFGGGEGVLQRLMRECVKRGHQTHLITGAWADTEPEITVHVVDFCRLTRAARMRGFSRAAMREAIRGDFDVIVSFDRTEYQHLWRAGEGVHQVWLERRRLFEPAWKVALASASAGQRAMLELEAAAVRSSRLIVSNSRLVAEDLRRTYGPETAAEIRVVYNGVDHSRFSWREKSARQPAARRELGCGSGPLMVFVGSGFRRKGLWETLLALQRLPEMKLVVAGRDSPRLWRRRAERLGVADRVTFAAPRRDPEIFYHAADIAVLPTWFDAFPNTTLESLACGTPVVTSSFSGSAEIIQPEVNGFVVERPDQIGKLVDAINDALELGRSSTPERIAETAAGFTVQACVEQFLGLMEEVHSES